MKLSRQFFLEVTKVITGRCCRYNSIHPVKYLSFEITLSAP